MALQYKILLHSISCFLSDEGTDEVYLKCKNKKIWPKEDKYASMKEGSVQPLELETLVAKGASISVEVWEFDTFSNDDNLGKFLLEADKIGGPYTTDMIKANNGKAKYSISWEVSS